ncbi:related to Peptidyl-tRNA hydrolase 2 [Saccharomycodes ludwigii]|uniref:peptidyl-tRNA hydrolase n=1 Tax=Saccharomycodes ludwigii TaxID=36035 RepID=A0A376B961_9ASCO|nr:related to Peptidyl-tRNA hydrolase 2 [Saccharomycodes ludwigii]
MNFLTVPSPTTLILVLSAFAIGYNFGEQNKVEPSFKDKSQNKDSKKKDSNKKLVKNKFPKAGEHNSYSENEDEDEDEDEIEIDSSSLNDISGEVRMALVIRQDLQMTKGKIAAQCCHAALACYRLIATDPKKESYNLPLVNRWLHGGQAKITLKCPNKEDMDLMFAQAISMGVNAYVVHDAGRTQIAAGSATVLGLGPAPKAVLDKITGNLKLY